MKQRTAKDGRHEEGRSDQEREEDGLCRATGGGLKEGHVSGSVDSRENPQ